MTTAERWKEKEEGPINAVEIVTMTDRAIEKVADVVEEIDRERDVNVRLATVIEAAETIEEKGTESTVDHVEEAPALVVNVEATVVAAMRISCH
jgi:hypothetical protein